MLDPAAVVVWRLRRRPHVVSCVIEQLGEECLELPTPYHQIDVKIAGVCTIVKSYLAGAARPIRIGDKVRARFGAGDRATHTALDLYFELE